MAKEKSEKLVITWVNSHGQFLLPVVKVGEDEDDDDDVVVYPRRSTQPTWAVVVVAWTGLHYTGHTSLSHRH